MRRNPSLLFALALLPLMACALDPASVDSGTASALVQRPAAGADAPDGAPGADNLGAATNADWCDEVADDAHGRCVDAGLDAGTCDVGADAAYAGCRGRGPGRPCCAAPAAAASAGGASGSGGAHNPGVIGPSAQMELDACLVTDADGNTLFAGDTAATCATYAEHADSACTRVDSHRWQSWSGLESSCAEAKAAAYSTLHLGFPEVDATTDYVLVEFSSMQPGLLRLPRYRDGHGVRVRVSEQDSGAGLSAGAWLRRASAPDGLRAPARGPRPARPRCPAPTAGRPSAARARPRGGPRRAVSTLRVADPGLWATLSEELDLDAHLGPALSEVERVALPSFVTEVLPGLEERILVRYARRDATEAAERAEAWRAVVADLPSRTRRVLHTAQRHAHEGVVLGLNAWDPHLDAAHVRALHGAGLIESVGDEALPYAGRYRLAEDLPTPPAVSLDLSEAVMEETDDLSEPEPGPGRILHDAAGLAAALDHVGPRRTHKDVLSKVDVRRLAKRLGDPGLAEQGALETHPRWGLALRALEALGAVSMDAFSRQLHLDLGLEGILQGETTDAIGRFAHKVLDRDLHPLLPAIREGLRQAGDGALDEVIFSDLLREQWREVLFAPWAREGLEVYPLLPGERLRLYHDDAWDRVEARPSTAPSAGCSASAWSGGRRASSPPRWTGGSGRRPRRPPPAHLGELRPGDHRPARSGHGLGALPARAPVLLPLPGRHRSLPAGARGAPQVAGDPRRGGGGRGAAAPGPGRAPWGRGHPAGVGARRAAGGPHPRDHRGRRGAGGGGASRPLSGRTVAVGARGRATGAGPGARPPARRRSRSRPPRLRLRRPRRPRRRRAPR